MGSRTLEMEMPDDNTAQRATAMLELPTQGGEGRKVDVHFPRDIEPEEWECVERYVHLYMALRDLELPETGELAAV